MAAAQPPHQRPMTFFCNGCLIELKLFDNAEPTAGGRIPKRYYTNCQHVLCQNCKMRYNDRCAACKKPCRTLEINNQMSSFHRTFFEPSVKMRANLIGAVQFQTIHREHVTSQMIAQLKQLHEKYREDERKLVEVKKKREDSLDEKRKIMIIFNKIRDETKRLVDGLYCIWY